MWQPVPQGATITGYVDDHWAHVDLPGNPGHLAHSTAPLRTKRNGKPTPVDLGLTRADGALRSANPLVGVTYRVTSAMSTRRCRGSGHSRTSASPACVVSRATGALTAWTQTS